MPKNYQKLSKIAPKFPKKCPKMCPKQSVKNFFWQSVKNPFWTFFETVCPKIRPSKKSGYPSVKKSVRHKKGRSVGGYSRHSRHFVSTEVVRVGHGGSALLFTHHLFGFGYYQVAFVILRGRFAHAQPCHMTIGSLVHWLIGSLAQPCWLNACAGISRGHWLIGSLAHWSSLVG